MELNVVFDHTNQVQRLVFSGRLNVDGALAIEQKLKETIAQTKHPAVFDLAAVDFLGSLGMRLLLAAAKELHRRGLSAVIFNPPPLVEESWYSAGLAALVPIEHDYVHAIAGLAKTRQPN